MYVCVYKHTLTLIQLVKNPVANPGDPRDASSSPMLGRSPGKGNGNSLHYSCLGNPMDTGPGILQSMGSQRISLAQLT